MSHRSTMRLHRSTVLDQFFGLSTLETS